MTAAALRCTGSIRTSGTAAVELALVLPLLMLLVLGGVDWGYYFFATQVTTNAAREGARAGSLQPTDAGLAEADARAAVNTYLTNGGLRSASATVNVTTPGNAVRVEVRYPAGSLTGFADVIIPSQVIATAQMRRL